MKVIRNINNNVAVCLDSAGREVVAFGKGIGFAKPPYEIGLGRIQKTYYGIDEIYIGMLNEIPEQLISLSDRIISYAYTKLANPVSSNIVITLADHIQFAIRRYEQRMNLTLPIFHDIRHLFETEMEIGEYGLSLIRREMKVPLPEEEAAYIALHIINAEAMDGRRKGKLDEDVIEDITRIIEKEFNIQIDQDNFHYSRFVSHMHYLLKRVKKNELMGGENKKLYASLVDTYPQIWLCSEKIRVYIGETMEKQLTDEECLYLMLHIHRLCSREDCCQ